MKIKLFDWMFVLGVAFPMGGWATEGALKNEEPTETEIRRLQTQLNILDGRITDPGALTQRRVLQDQLFQKIRRLHDNNRQEKDIVGGIESQKRAELIRQNRLDTAPEIQPSRISASSKPEEEEAMPVAPLKVTPPQPRSNTPPPSQPRPQSTAAPSPSVSTPSKPGEDRTLEIYKSIIDYSKSKSPSTAPAKKEE